MGTSLRISKSNSKNTGKIVQKSRLSPVAETAPQGSHYWLPLVWIGLLRPGSLKVSLTLKVVVLCGHPASSPLFSLQFLTLLTV